MPRVFDRYESVEDPEVTVMSLNKLVQLREDRKDRLRNDNFIYDFSIQSIDSLAPEISKALFKSQNVKISLSECPFTTFGKTVNVRIKNYKGVQPFPLVLSHAPFAQVIKVNILARFFQAFPDKKSDIFTDVGVYTDMNALLSKSTKALQRTQTRDELIPAGQTSIAKSIPDVLDEQLAIIFQNKDSEIAKKLSQIPAKSAVFDVRGPFGTGLEINRFTSGHILLVGQGSGSFSYIDLVDYLTRYYLVKYAKAKKPHDFKLLSDLDCLHDDLELSFANLVTFDFYLTFKNKRDFEALFMRDFALINTLESELKLGVIGRIVIRFTKLDSTYPERFAGIEFVQTKVDSKTIGQTMTSLGLETQEADKKVEKVIVCGRREFCREWVKGLESIGLENYKIKSL